MTITTNSSPEVSALEQEIETLEQRAEEIKTDINDARADVADAQSAFIINADAKAGLLVAQQNLAALEGAATAIQTRIEAKEKDLEKAHKTEQREAKRAQALEIAATIETKRNGAHERAATIIAALETLPALVETINNAGFQARRLRNLLENENAPQFKGADLERINDLATEGRDSIKAQIYTKNGESAALNQFRELLERAINGFSVAAPEPATAPADLSDINRFAAANVELDRMLDARKIA